MIPRRPVLTLLAVGMVLSLGTLAPAQVIVNMGQSGGGMVVSNWGLGGNASFEQFYMMITQLNMSPDFTLDKATKVKLRAVREDWNKAQTKFREEHKEEFQKISKQLMEAYQAKDQEQIKALVKQQQDLAAKGPKADDFIAQAKAALPADQLKVVEDKIAKTEAEQKARMEEWRKREETERRGGGAGEVKD